MKFLKNVHLHVKFNLYLYFMDKIWCINVFIVKGYRARKNVPSNELQDPMKQEECIEIEKLMNEEQVIDLPTEEAKPVGGKENESSTMQLKYINSFILSIIFGLSGLILSIYFVFKWILI